MSQLLSDQELREFEIYKQQITKPFLIFVRPDVGWVAVNSGIFPNRKLSWLRDCQQLPTMPWLGIQLLTTSLVGR